MTDQRAIPSSDPGVLELVDLLHTRSLLDALAELHQVTPELASGTDGPQITWTPPGGTPLTVQLTDESRDLLDRLARAGDAARAARAQVAQYDREQRERGEARAHEALRARYENPPASMFGLTDRGDAWALPAGGPAVRVHRVPVRPVNGWTRPPLARLEVTTTSGLVLGHVEVGVDEQVTSLGAHARQHFPLEDREARALAAKSPWAGRPTPAGTCSVVEHITALAEIGLSALDWIDRMDAAVQALEARVRAREAEATEWARLSRSKERIPNKALNDWMRAESDLQHDNTGYVVSGNRIVAEIISGRERPAHLDKGARGPVGVTRVLYVAKLTRKPVRSSSSWRPRFYESEIERLRAALPGCVVKVPEDHRAIFVAFDAPEHREALDAAVAEWVLTGAGDE